MSTLSPHNFTQMSDSSSSPDLSSISIFLTISCPKQPRNVKKHDFSIWLCNDLSKHTDFLFVSFCCQHRHSREVELQPPRILNTGTKGLCSAWRTGPFTPDAEHRLEPVWTLRRGENLSLLPTIAPRFLGRFGHFTDWAKAFHGNVPDIKEIISKIVTIFRIRERLTTVTTKSMTSSRFLARDVV